MRNLFVKTALVLCTTIIFLPATVFATEPQNTEITSAEEGFTDSDPSVSYENDNSLTLDVKISGSGFSLSVSALSGVFSSSAGGSVLVESSSFSSSEKILHKPQVLLEDSNLSGGRLEAGSTTEMSLTFRNKSCSQNVIFFHLMSLMLNYLLPHRPNTLRCL